MRGWGCGKAQEAGLFSSVCCGVVAESESVAEAEVAERADSRCITLDALLLCRELATQEVPIRGALRTPAVPAEVPQEVVSVIEACMQRDSGAPPPCLSGCPLCRPAGACPTPVSTHRARPGTGIETDNTHLIEGLRPCSFSLPVPCLQPSAPARARSTSACTAALPRTTSQTPSQAPCPPPAPAPTAPRRTAWGARARTARARASAPRRTSLPAPCRSRARRPRPATGSSSSS